MPQSDGFGGAVPMPAGQPPPPAAPGAAGSVAGLHLWTAVLLVLLVGWCTAAAGIGVAAVSVASMSQGQRQSAAAVLAAGAAAVLVVLVAVTAAAARSRRGATVGQLRTAARTAAAAGVVALAGVAVSWLGLWNDPGSWPAAARVVVSAAMLAVCLRTWRVVSEALRG